MTNVSEAFRGLIVYALILPIAVLLGYLLGTPTDASSAGTIVVVLGILVLPLLLKWHHPILFLTWNMSAVVFFFPGSPQVWMAMAFVSLFISIGQRALRKEKQFMVVPSLAFPIAYLVLVVLITGEATGGFGMRLFGSGVVGGRRYLLIFAGVAGFFAMTAQRIPRERALLYFGLFFLGNLVNVISTLIPYAPRELYSLALMFPVSLGEVTSSSVSELAGFEFNQGVIRYFSAAIVSLSFSCYMLGRYGVRGLFSTNKLWRPILFAGIVAVGSLGGFRSFFIQIGLTFLLIFYWEGLFRSRYLLGFLLVMAVTGTTLLLFADKLPLSVQRTISFLPVKIDPIARFDAESSSEWRVQMWNIVIPEVPTYFWLGKGLGIDARDLAMGNEFAQRGFGSTQEIAALAGDYHNGPLTILIPFGIWGALGWLWFVFASVRALYRNYRYGPAELRRINTLLLAYFVARMIFFLSVYGSFYTDFAQLLGLLGLSISLNDGIRGRPEALPSNDILVHEAELAPAPMAALQRT